MSEQLSLDGLLAPKSAESKDSKSPKKATKLKTSSSKNDSQDSGIQARIDALIEQKKKLESPIEKKVQAPSAQSAILPGNMIASPKIEFSEKETTIIIEEEEIILEEPAKNEPEVLTVSSLNKSIKSLLEKSYPFLWVKGEISNLKIPGSGHLYFTLKDSQSQIRAIMFRGFAQSLKFKPEDGMEILVRCRVTAYEPRGDYQLFCEVMEPVGFGALQIAFEKLKEKLQAEGLFNPAKKRAMPAFPSRIGIITSPTGAAIRDMINVLTRRSGGSLDITILPTSVQGDKAPGEIVKAIDLANSMASKDVNRFDVLIIGRGGGSLEDLWAFNTEEVARAVARSNIPTISAVGHEVDFTICDFVADLRAPTPSAAAELVVKNKHDLIERIELITRHLVQQINKKIQLAHSKASGLSKRLIDPKRRLQDLMLRCDEWSDRLLQSMQRFLQDNSTSVKFLRERLGSPEKRLLLWKQRIDHADTRMETAASRLLERRQSHLSKLAGLLNGLSPLAILGRGYSIVKRGSEIVKDASQVKKGDLLKVTLHQGEISTEVK